jgi:hypothetical protein
VKIRPNPFFPGESKPLSNAIGVVWRELATSVNSLIDAFNGIDTTGGGGNSNRWGSGVDTTDDVIIDDSDSGVVLKSPDGHYWRVQVTNAGALTITDIGTSKP